MEDRVLEYYTRSGAKTYTALQNQVVVEFENKFLQFLKVNLLLYEKIAWYDFEYDLRLSLNIMIKDGCPVRDAICNFFGVETHSDIGTIRKKIYERYQQNAYYYRLTPEMKQGVTSRIISYRNNIDINSCTTKISRQKHIIAAFLQKNDEMPWSRDEQAPNAADLISTKQACIKTDEWLVSVWEKCSRYAILEDRLTTLRHEISKLEQLIDEKKNIM